MLAIETIFSNPCSALSFTSCLPCATQVSSYPLFQRISDNWKTLLMDASTIASITCLFVAIFTQANLFCGIFTLTSFASTVGSYYLRQYALLQTQEEIIDSLRVSQQDFTNSLANLETQNQHLLQTQQDLETRNQALINTNQALNETHRGLVETHQNLQGTYEMLNQEHVKLGQTLLSLETTNNNLSDQNNRFESENKSLLIVNSTLKTTNERLQTEVTKLTLQVNHLIESAKSIHREAKNFKGQNQGLARNIRKLDAMIHKIDQQIENAETIHDEVKKYLEAQDTNLFSKLDQIGTLLTTLNEVNISDKLKAFQNLNESIIKQTQELNALHQEHSKVQGQLSTLYDNLEQLKSHFDDAISQTAAQMQGTQESLSEEVKNLKNQRERIQEVLNNFLPHSTVLNTHSLKQESVII